MIFLLSEFNVLNRWLWLIACQFVEPWQMDGSTARNKARRLGVQFIDCAMSVPTMENNRRGRLCLELSVKG
jgi:hypothetical protein